MRVRDMCVSFFLPLVLSLLASSNTVHSTPLDDYVSAPDDHYKWDDTGYSFTTKFGGTAYVLNVTSQQWMDTSRGAVLIGDEGGKTAIWTHQVVVIVPKTLKYTNISMAYLTGDCNQHPSNPTAGDEDVLVADEITWATNAIGIVVFQIPNCPYVYPTDPEQKHRTEDAMIAWAWHQYLVNPTSKQDPLWLPRLPMTKAAFQCMRAAEEFTTQKKIAAIEGWFVAGASKRGWTTWLVGSATCESCPKILGIAPLVPIVPNLREEMHRQWKSYNGWTFAFADYIAINLTQKVDDPDFAPALDIIDPMNYLDRLERLPKFVVLSSDDEFMQFDWSNIWYNEMKGETHLMISENTEHSLSTGIPQILTMLSTAINSIAAGNDASHRPSFEYTFDNNTGTITVTVPPSSSTPTKVLLRYAETLQDVRRDFRWVRSANNDTQPCTKPFIPLPTPVFGGNCLQPIIWRKKMLNATSADPRTFTAVPPEPKSGYWIGYYVELYFGADTNVKTEYKFTTPGYAWPNTLPFPDCFAETCVGRVV